MITSLKVAAPEPFVKFITVCARHYSLNTLQSRLNCDVDNIDLDNDDLSDRDVWVREAAVLEYLDMFLGHVKFRLMSPMFGSERMRMDVIGCGKKREAYVITFKE